MAKEKNLIPQAHKLTVDEQSAGGKASGEARRQKKELRQMLELLLDKEYTDKKGTTATGREAISTALIGQALKGNVKAFEMIRDTIGEKPVEKVMISEVEQSVIDEVEDIVNDANTSG